MLLYSHFNRINLYFMNLISQLLPPSNVIVDLDVASKKRVLNKQGYYLKIRSISLVAKFLKAYLLEKNLDQPVWAKVSRYHMEE